VSVPSIVVALDLSDAGGVQGVAHTVAPSACAAKAMLISAALVVPAGDG